MRRARLSEVWDPEEVSLPMEATMAIKPTRDDLPCFQAHEQAA